MKRISFETAKAISHIYKEYTTKAYSSTGELIEPYYGGKYHNLEDDNGDCVYAAPYQAQLQEWLRNEYGVSVLVYLDETLSYFWIIINLNTRASLTEYHGPEKVHCKHYETCLEDGLRAALHLL